MAARKARKPKCKKSEYPTLTGKPQLGYLNAYYCPVCGKHLTRSAAKLRNKNG